MASGRWVVAGVMAVVAAGLRGQEAAPVIRQEVRLVTLDVIATDKDGRTPRDLTAEDFVVTENGVAQKVSHAEAHLWDEGGKGGQQARAGLSPARLDAAPGAGGKAVRFSNRDPYGSGVWNVILVDGLNTTTGDQAQARKQLTQFVKTLPKEVPLALVTMDPELRVLAAFRGGAAGVDAVLAGGAAQPKLAPQMEPFNADDQYIQEHIQAKMPDKGAAQRDGMQTEEMARLSMRVQTMFQNLGLLAEWLGRYPGKKNVFWLSTGFPLLGVPTKFASSGGSSENLRARFQTEQSDLDRRLEAARVAIFPIDTRGVLDDYPGMHDATRNGGQYVGSVGAHELEADTANYSRQQTEELQEEQSLAEDTGGIVKYNSNDISGMLTSAYRQSQRFYTVAYAPANKNWDGKYRRIVVKLKDRRGYQLAYRRGYFAVDAGKPAGTSVDDFTRALRRSAPPARGVLFTTAMQRTADALVLDYAVDVATLEFAGDAQGRMAGVDCAVVEYDRAGSVLGTAQIHVEGKVKPGQWSQVEAQGFPAHQVVPLKAEAASITIGIRDHASGVFGNMEVALGPE